MKCKDFIELHHDTMITFMQIKIQYAICPKGATTLHMLSIHFGFAATPQTLIPGPSPHQKGSVHHLLNPASISTRLGHQHQSHVSP